MSYVQEESGFADITIMKRDAGRQSKVSPLVGLLLVILTGSLFAQNVDETLDLRRGFGNLDLGISFAAAQELLRESPYFLYRGEPDISLRLSDAGTVIDTRGLGYVQRGLLQFESGHLYQLTLYLNPSRLDYFQVFEQLRRRYGDPRDLNPRRSLWEDESTRIELERPVTVRYLDLSTFEERRRDRQQLRALEDVTREEFLREF